MNFQPFCYQPDVVFEGRNKAYGAYSIRKIYEKRILVSVAIAILAFGIGMGGPVLYNTFGPAEKVEKNLKTNKLKKLPPPPVNKKLPPPPEIPPPPPPPKKVATIKFPPPVPDPDVKEDEIPPVKETKGKAIDVKNQDGNEDKGDPTPPPIDKKPDLPIDPPKTDDQVYTVVQQQPAFAGDMGKFLKKNFKYPKNALRQGIEGNVFVSFVVRKDGAIDNVTLLKGLSNCPECNDEAIRLVKMMPPWTPGMQNGNAVNVSFRLPIKFKIQE